MEHGLALLANASMPLNYSVEAFRVTIYLTNILPTPLLHHQSPLEKLYSTVPDYSTLKVLGYKCYPNIRPF